MESMSEWGGTGSAGWDMVCGRKGGRGFTERVRGTRKGREMVISRSFVWEGSVVVMVMFCGEAWMITHPACFVIDKRIFYSEVVERSIIFIWRVLANFIRISHSVCSALRATRPSAY